MPKRIFDIFFSFLTLVFFSWLIAFSWILCSIDTNANGIFVQERVGQYGRLFKIYKLRTVNVKDNHISVFGSFLRKYKIDELAQLWNVLLGNMSLVGPRPDILGYYDMLEGEERKVLDLKPGITSSASLKYFNEEYILQRQPNPEKYNDEVIFKDKVKMNLEYYYKRNYLVEDIKIIFETICFLIKIK
jgi:lipopolysaccharide/colanic/teichoic acid biosynthesis glycosyltransferase